jgi:hypothetical protein
MVFEAIAELKRAEIPPKPAPSETNDYSAKRHELKKQKTIDSPLSICRLVLNKKLTCSSAKTVVLSFLASFQL